ncbi:phospholipase [Chitinophaga sp. SYP-B3965]|uniref:carboxylesterase family protein n=1 Tax=Chitinophaga sp. SYP-B3965 TaxID=2663120 RepID=UPI001299A2BB|nr:alpha/beta hydrolase-fold protein [Chitinophaga sp. SYP-B3965]MRG45935.1 phospholipase [Chitinophaga sp. SYP-B3965]
MKYALLFLLCTLPFLGYSQAAFEARTFVRGSDTLPYRILMPVDYKPGTEYPLILVMHGAGERGNDNISQLKHGSKLFLNDSLRKEYPAIVVFPQCAKNSSWAVMQFNKDSVGWGGVKFIADTIPTVPAGLLHQLMDSLLHSGSVDYRRIYVGGLSMGGIGTFDMLARYPNRFAAAFPICGAGNEEYATRFADGTAVWIFHGAEDKTVPTKFSQDYYKRLKMAGCRVLYTEYPGVGHNSWDNAFAEPDLLSWMFSFKRK